MTTVHVNEAPRVDPAASVATTVTVEVPAVVRVPEITPVAGLIVSPAGSPVAE